MKRLIIYDFIIIDKYFKKTRNIRFTEHLTVSNPETCLIPSYFKIIRRFKLLQKFYIYEPDVYTFVKKYLSIIKSHHKFIVELSNILTRLLPHHKLPKIAPKLARYSIDGLKCHAGLRYLRNPIEICINDDTQNL